MIPLAVYVHIPWCEKRCLYCDFNAYGRRGPLPVAEYVLALRRDLDAMWQLAGERPVVSVFFGGGTPSLLPAAAIAEVIAHLRPSLVADAEITLEANPGTVDETALAALLAAGVTRLSVGAQSFDERYLKRLGRIHDAEAVVRTVTAARHVGFAECSIDLMYALPDQPFADACADIDRALTLPLTHLSCYELTVMPDTPFARQQIRQSDDDERAEMQHYVTTACTSAGLPRYEIANYGSPCRHNVNYWQFGDYIGVGAGAHGKLTLADGTSAIIRTQRPKAPNAYMAAVVAGDAPISERVVAEALPLEFMMGALRLTGGFSVPLFTARTGLPWETVAATVAGLVDDGLLVTTGERVVPSARGLLLLDTMLDRFLSVPASVV